MPELDSYRPGDRIYGSLPMARAAGETESVDGTTGTVILKDATGATIATLTATITVAVGGASLTATYEHTLAADAVPGVWTEQWTFAGVLIAVRVFRFRVVRLG